MLSRPIGNETSLAVWFDRPGVVVLREEPVRRPERGEVTIRAVASLISSGTELRVLRGEIAPDTELGLETCSGSFSFPVKYAYQVVGEVLQAGADVRMRKGELVFARHPHQELFTMRYAPDLVFPLPSVLPVEHAAFSNMMSVAVSALLDVPVRLGDNVAVFGLGPIGLFCALLAARTAATVWAIDTAAPRLERIRRLDAGIETLHPDAAPAEILDRTGGRGLDIVFEASGAPAALQAAIAVLGQEGTLGVVSYYGDREVSLRLSPEFHFRRQRIVSTQAGSIGSGLQPRWSRQRRLEVAWSLLSSLSRHDLVSHRFDFGDAPRAYELLDRGLDDPFGILLQYK